MKGVDTVRDLGDDQGNSAPRALHSLIFQPPAAEVALESVRGVVLDQLLRPSWSEIADAQRRHEAAAKRLRRWQWWFIGMFTVYTTLSGILLFDLLLHA